MGGRRKKWGAALVLVLTLIGGGWYLVNANLGPALESIARTRVDAAASDAMYLAVLDHLSEEDRYEQLVTIESTGERVVYVETNSRALNLLAANCAQEAQEHLDAAGEQGVDVPLGTLTGMPVLAGRGPNVHVTFAPESNINAEIQSDFLAAGINQTLHRISVRLVAFVTVVLPGDTFTLEADAVVPVAENIIVGAVPETYAAVGDRPEILNLVP